jgi:tetratricopeptide (TPR) repeat protein
MKIVDDYSGTEQGEIAKVYLAHSYYYQEDFSKALEYYDSYSGNNNLFKATALAGKAACYEALKDHELAAKYYKDAAFISEFNPSNSEYLLRAGLNYLDAGNKDEAKNVFTRIKEDYSTTQVGRQIDKYLLLLES